MTLVNRVLIGVFATGLVLVCSLVPYLRNRQTVVANILVSDLESRPIGSKEVLIIEAWGLMQPTARLIKDRSYILIDSHDFAVLDDSFVARAPGLVSHLTSKIEEQKPDWNGIAIVAAKRVVREDVGNDFTGRIQLIEMGEGWSLAGVGESDSVTSWVFRNGQLMSRQRRVENW